MFAKDGKFDKMLNDTIIKELKSYKLPINISESYRAKYGNNIIPLIGSGIDIRVKDKENKDL